MLARIASFLLLPLYTSYLRPADYGVIAILDFFSALIVVVISSGMLAAVTRYHFAEKLAEMQRSVWWTGMMFIAIAASFLVGVGAVFGKDLAEIALGSTVKGREEFLYLTLATIWVGCLGHLPLTYFRVRKWSHIFVTFSIGRLLVNIALNVYFLTVLELGVQGVLMGNLLTGCINTFGVFIIFSGRIGTFSIKWDLGKRLWGFAGPLIFTGFLSAMMHQTNLFFLRVFGALDQVGLFSLAYTLGQGINSLMIIPFEMIWGVVIYEVAKESYAKKIYVQVCEYFMYVVALLLLGLALFAKPLLQVMVAPDYLSAYSLVPIICLAFVFFSLHLHFRIPALLAKRTGAIIPVTVFALLVNIGANLMLIPLWGTFGAAWASVLGFMAYSIGGLWWYRRIERYEYPFASLSLVCLGMIASYLIFWGFEQWVQRPVWVFSFGVLLWALWASGLLWRLFRAFGSLGGIEDKEKVAFGNSTKIN